MAESGRRPSTLLRAVIGIGCVAYIACCLLAIPFVDDMRNFPTSSREVMVVVLLAFTAAAAGLSVALLQGRAWAAWIATAVGLLGLMLFIQPTFWGSPDPEWLDAEAAARSVGLRVFVGCGALTIAGISAVTLSRRVTAAMPPVPSGT